MKRLMIILVVMAIGSHAGLQGSRIIRDQEIQQIEKSIKGYRSYRERLERKRTYTATLILNRQKDVYSRMELLEESRAHLQDIDGELSDLNQTVDDLANREAMLMEKLTESSLGTRKVMRRVLQQHGYKSPSKRSSSKSV